MTRGQAIGETRSNVRRPAGRAATLLLGAGGILFAVYLLTRPYGSGGDGVEQFTSTWWVISHTAAMLGFVVIAWGLATRADALRDTPGYVPARVGAGFSAAGTALMLPYYGAETFALHVLGGDPQFAAVGGEVAVAETIRLQPVAAGLFGIGLIAFALGASAAADGFRRSGGSAFVGTLFAAAWVLFIPQFFLPPAARMGCGVLLLVACVVFAVAQPRER